MVVLSLSLGIGASTALFSILNSLLLRSLPVRDPGDLAFLSDSGNRSSWTNPQWELIRNLPGLADGALASAPATFDTSQSGRAEFINGLYASGSFFDVLGVPALLGRTFTVEDDRRGGDSTGPVAVLGYGFWQRRFGGAADVIGRTISLDRVPFTIVGIAPPGFFGVTVGSTFDVAVPLGAEALVRGRESVLDHRSYWWLSVLIRLRADQSLQQATAAIRAVQPQIRDATMPTDWPAELATGYLRRPFQFRSAAAGQSVLRTSYQQPLVALLVAVGLLLLIACANIASLMLARAAARRHELAVRAALGASKVSLARPLLMESLLLSGTGGLLGLVFAQWAGRLIVAGLSTPLNPVVLDMTLDWRVLAFAAGVTMCAVAAFGTAPAFRAAQAMPRDALAEGRWAIAGRDRLGLSGALVVTQVALSLALVVSAGLFARTFAALASVHLGFDRRQVLVAEISARQEASAVEGRNVLFEHVRQAVRAVPGVQEAAFSRVTPVGGRTWSYGVEVIGEPSPTEGIRTAYVNAVSPGWFATYGTALVAGRDFDDRDVESAPRSAIVNREFVRRFLNGRNPLGRLVRQVPLPAGPKVPALIVGVVEDAVYRSLREPVPPTLYLAHAQQERSGMRQEFLSIRSGGPPVMALVGPLTEALGGANGDLSFAFRPLAEQVDGALIRERLVAMLSGFFGGMALLLAALGVYGVTTYSVSQRRGEIGIRIALGGRPASVVLWILRRVVWLVCIGLALGSLACYWGARFLTTLVYGIEPRDPATFVAAILILTVAGLLAAWLPARRASRIDPLAVMRG